MKKITLILFLCTGGLASAQNSLLFEISGNGLEKSSYLFGTMHVQNEEVFGWNDSVFYAIDATDEAAFELDMGNLNLKKQLKGSKKILKGWKDFAEKEIAPEVESRIEADTLADRVLTLYGKFLDMAMDMQKNQRGTFVDMFLQEYARKNEKEVIGIESFSEQINIILEMDKAEIKKGIISFLDKDDWDVDPAMFVGSQESLIEAYATKELTQVCSFLDETMTSSSNAMMNDLYQRLFFDRNKIMAKRTLKMLKHKPMFIAVGAGHLCGKSGLVEQYRKAGYTVRAVDIKTATETRKMDWQAFDNEEFAVEIPDGVSDFYTSGMSFSGIGGMGNVSSSIYTGQGKATFSISKTDGEYDMGDYDYEYSEEQMEAADAMEADEYIPEEYEEAPAEEADGEMGVDYMEATAEEAEAEMATEHMDVEVEIDMVESVEVTAEIVEMDVEEPVEEVMIQEPDETIYEGEDLDQGDTEYEEENKSIDMGALFGETPSTEGMDYWEIVKTKVVSGFMQMVMKSVGSARDFMDPDDAQAEPKTDSLALIVMGETHYVYYSHELLSGSQAAMDIEKEGITYTLKISGDPKVIKSETLNQFFESFFIKEF